MLTASPRALTLATMNRLEISADEIACNLRVSDPGDELSGGNAAGLHGSIFPLTLSVALATLGNSAVQTQAYRNYAGQSVVDDWGWNPNWSLGIIVEQDAERAFWISFVRNDSIDHHFFGRDKASSYFNRRTCSRPSTQPV